MVDNVTPDQVRSRRFDIVRRGYERADVDTYLDGVASQLDDLSARVVEAKASALAIGIDDPEALANELKNVGGEVGAVLEAARAAAEGLRTRAGKDADTWRSNAQRESTALVEDATEQSQSMRASAWNDGTSMLTSAEAESHSHLETAQEDSLFMRAEAERDALRLTSDARRDKEELLRVARLEADSIIEEARTESDGVLAAADKQAEAAQERARALEDRRSELLSELEATRTSISQLEEEIDSRRQALETPDPVPEPEPEPEPHTHRSIDSGSVKIVPPSRVVALRPVDADEFVADVEAIRSASMAKAAEPEPPETVAVIAPPPDTEVAAVTDPEPALLEVEPEPPGAGVDTPGDEIGSLFAQLRDDTDEQPVAAGTAAATGTEAAEAVPRPHPEAEPEPESDPVVPHKPKANRTAAPKATSDSAGSMTPADVVSATPKTADPVAPSGALAAQNAALKAVKRALVDLQNETLEALRTDEAWVPAEGSTDRFEASFLAFGESVGADSAADSSSAFASDLHDAVTSAIEDERGLGSGSRAVASAASKVFRTWRSDEAERRLLALTP
jgi:DivIVA domain-containing protein